LLDKWTRNAILLGLVLLLDFCALRVAVAFTPLYVYQMGLAEQRAALIAGTAGTASALALIVSAPLWGLAGDRWGRRLMLIRGTIGCVIVLVGLAYSTRPFHVIIFRFVQGGFTGIRSAGPALMASIVPREKIGNGIGIAGAAFFGGAVVGPILAGILSDFFGLSNAFLFMTCFPLLSILILIFFFDEIPIPDDHHLDDENHGRKLESLSLVNTSQFRTLLMLGFGTRLAVMVAEPVLPLMIQSRVQTGAIASTVGIVLATGSACSAVAAITFGILADRLPYAKIIPGAAMFAGFAAMLYPITYNIQQLVILVAVSGLSLGVIRSANDSLLGLIVPERNRSTGYGTAIGAESAGGAIGSTAGGMIASAAGIPKVFLVLGFLYVAIAGWTQRSLQNLGTAGRRVGDIRVQIKE
jgi:DHA1 family multidrug resistance protein-like MFS transporter